MANFANSIGYRLERLHSGMIVYLCGLWNEGNTEPLESMLERLGLPSSSILPSNNEKLSTRLEYESIDLVLFTDDKPCLAIEMKVDSHEKDNVKGRDGKKDYQTVVYPERVPECEHFIFLTLGLGEYYRAPYSNEFRWVRIEHFLESLKAISDTDPFIRAWREAIQEEKAFQEKCRSGDPAGVDDERAERWNVYFLGFLKEELEKSLSGSLEVDLTAYPYGSNDTILNFGNQPREPCYMEINANGKLNLKVNLEAHNETADKYDAIQRAQNYYKRQLKASEDECKSIGTKPGKTKTIIQFDVALKKINKKFFTFRDETEAHARISEIVGRFYGNVPSLI